MGTSKDIRVLIAEDDYLVSEMIRGLLEEMGYDIVGEAADGLEAVELTQRVHPDVVLMDIKMPDVDGIEAMERIYDICPTPVVILTAYETPELVGKASAAGAGAYLVKPLSAPEIERAITVAIARFGDLIELHRLNDELRARNEELDAFGHTVAHDLKDLLARIVGYTGTLAESLDTIPADELRRHLHTVAQSGFKMSRIIDALLLLTQVRKVSVKMDPLDMTSILSEATHRLADLAEERDAEVILADHWSVALGYAPWVEEVWVNYLSNAIKYGGDPPRVELGSSTQSDGAIRFWIRDNGAGIPREMHDRLFKPFSRLDVMHAYGSGLGLSIAKRIVEKLGGQVGIESTVGQGSVFSFTLPSARSQPDVTAGKDEDENGRCDPGS